MRLFQVNRVTQIDLRLTSGVRNQISEAVLLLKYICTTEAIAVNCVQRPVLAPLVQRIVQSCSYFLAHLLAYCSSAKSRSPANLPGMESEQPVLVHLNGSFACFWIDAAFCRFQVYKSRMTYSIQDLKVQKKRHPHFHSEIGAQITEADKIKGSCIFLLKAL